MSKVDFEYYPHVVDLIWEHISDPCTVYTAGQVCSSWRTRALKVIYRRLSAELDLSNGRWYLWMWADSGKAHVRYLLDSEAEPPSHPPDASSDSPPLQVDMPTLTPTLSSNIPVLDLDLANRYTKVLDLPWPAELRDSPASWLPFGLFGLSTLQITRVHIEDCGDAEGTGPTQVYFWFSYEASRITIAAHNVNTLVLTITVEKPLNIDALFDADVFLSDQLHPESYAATELVIVLQRYQNDYKFSSSTLAGDIAHYISSMWSELHITVVGAEGSLAEEDGHAYARLQTGVMNDTAFQSPAAKHRVKFLTHAEYEALVGPETYKLHCVPDFW